MFSPYSDRCIRNLKKKIEETGSYARRRGGGRPRCTTPAKDLAIRLNVKRANRKSAVEIKKELGLECHVTTVRSRIREDGTKSFIVKRKPFISKKNQKARVAWCKAHAHWTEADWEKVLWTDESPFGLRFQGAERVYCKPNHRLLKQNLRGTVKHQKKVMVWGGFCAAGVGRLHKIEGKMVKEQYLEILNQQGIPSGLELLGEWLIF